MELLDFIQSIGGHISLSADINGDDCIRVVVTQGFTQALCYRPYPGGSGSVFGNAKIKNGDLNVAYEKALIDLAKTFNNLDCRQVGFDVQPLYIVPKLTHTKGYRPKTKKKAKEVTS